MGSTIDGGLSGLVVGATLAAERLPPTFADQPSRAWKEYLERDLARKSISKVSDNFGAKVDEIGSMLKEKNAKYGNSALEPCRIFSKASPVEQILVRIDDKLSRIRTTGSLAGADEDTLMDLIGYLILLCIARKGT